MPLVGLPADGNGFFKAGKGAKIDAPSLGLHLNDPFAGSLCEGYADHTARISARFGRVAAVYGVRNAAKICNPIIRLVAVNMIYVAVGLGAVIKHVGSAVRKQPLRVNHAPKIPAPVSGDHGSRARVAAVPNRTSVRRRPLAVREVMGRPLLPNKEARERIVGQLFRKFRGRDFCHLHMVNQGCCDVNRH